ncbi:glycosyltransferase, partial [Waltera sp.]|uniref:glycosyltransferase n=1 Tax=Waltera sp. TaxID=2815806 RepID=UPI003AB96336
MTKRFDMRKIRVVQQYVNAANNGGLKTEYEALNNRKNLLDEYEFIPVVLNNCHCGLSLSDIRFYRRAIGKADPDIVHIRGAGMESLNAVLGAKLSGSGKILVTVHGMFSDLVYYSPIKRWVCRYVVEPMIFGLSDGISCVYERAAQRDVFRRYRKKMLPFVYNRMPQYPDCSAEEKRALRKELNLPENARIGIYVGRVTKEKGLSYLVDALKQVDACWPPELCLLIVGNGDYLQEMQSECAALQHAKRVIFAWQQEQIQKYLNASDFFLSP